MTDRQADAFESVYREYNGLLYGFAHSILHSRALAEDVVQDAFVRAISSLDLSRDRASVRSWLYATVHNLAVDYLRREGRSAGEEPLFYTASAEGERLEQMTLLNEVMSALSGPETRILMLTTAGFRQREIAKMLDLPLGTVSWRIHNIRRKISALRSEEKGE